VTLCGARAELLDEVAQGAAAPALASLLARATWRATFPSGHVDCAEAHRERLALAAARNPAPSAASAAFLSRSELRGVAATLGCGVEEGPRLEEFSLAIAGADAAPLRLRRDVDATAAAARAWLATATTPFFLWVQLDASACEAAPAGAPPEALRAVAIERLVAVDRAVGSLLQELARGGRDARTRLVLATDHGEALGEEECFGPRHSLPVATDAACWVVEPSGALKMELARAAAPPPAAELDGAPWPLAWLRGRPFADEAEARAVAGAIDAALRAGRRGPRLVERHVEALWSVAVPAATDLAQRVDAGRYVATSEGDAPPDQDARTLTLAARGELGERPLAERLASAEAACRAAPWYFPAFRALASLRQQQADVRGALAALDAFERDAPLSQAAREEFRALHAKTRQRLEAGVPGGKPPR